MSRILVVSVDRDDDLGQKAKINGPIIGKQRNIEAAKRLLMVDPTESDANAIFEAVRVLDELGKDGLDVVTLTGHTSRGYKADKKILLQLDEVLRKYKKLDGIYLVTDGADDDEVIPILQSRVKIISKKTMIVKQAVELEKSYYVLKQVLRDPHFARIVFGLPGVILLTIAFLQELGARLIVLTVGLYLLLKGFGLEDPIINAFRNFRETTSIERASFPLYVGSFLTILLSVWAGFEKVKGLVDISPIQVGASFIGGFINLFIVGVILFFIGRIGDMGYRRELQQIRKYLLSIITVIALWFVITRAVNLVFGLIQLDEFLAWVIVAFIFTVVGVSVVRRIYTDRYVSPKLKKKQEVYDTEGKFIGEISEVNNKNRSVIIGIGKQARRIPYSKIVVVKEDTVSVRL